MPNLAIRSWCPHLGKICRDDIDGQQFGKGFVSKLLISMHLLNGTVHAFQEVPMRCGVVYLDRHGRNRERYICHSENSATEAHTLTQNLNERC